MAFRKTYGKKKFTPRRKYGKTKSKGKARASFKAKVKRVILNTAEPKHIDYRMTNSLGENLPHNTIQAKVINLANAMPAQGIGDNNRVGDQINTSGWLLCLMICQKADSPNMTFKYWIVEVNKGETYAYSAWFDNVTNNTMLDKVSTDMCKIKKTGTWKPYQGAMSNGMDEYTFTKSIYIPHKKLIKFTRNASNTHDARDLYILLVAYDAYGSLLTDTIASYEMVSTLYFKDP